MRILVLYDTHEMRKKCLTASTATATEKQQFF